MVAKKPMGFAVPAKRGPGRPKNPDPEAVPAAFDESEAKPDNGEPPGRSHKKKTGPKERPGPKPAPAAPKPAPEDDDGINLWDIVAEPDILEAGAGFVLNVTGRFSVNQFGYIPQFPPAGPKKIAKALKHAIGTLEVRKLGPWEAVVASTLTVVGAGIWAGRFMTDEERAKRDEGKARAAQARAAKKEAAEDAAARKAVRDAADQAVKAAAEKSGAEVTSVKADPVSVVNPSGGSDPAPGSGGEPSDRGGGPQGAGQVNADQNVPGDGGTPSPGA